MPSAHLQCDGKLLALDSEFTIVSKLNMSRRREAVAALHVVHLQTDACGIAQDVVDPEASRMTETLETALLLTASSIHTYRLRT